MTSIRRVMVANRGEIALRLLRGLRQEGLETVAVYSDADRGAPYLRAADRAVCLGEPAPQESYLVIDKLIEAGRAAEIDAVHPGYGFLSENAAFATAVEAEGWTFIGPTPASIGLMGDKTRAGRAAAAAGVPTVPAYMPEVADPALDELVTQAKKLGLPLMIKAAAGGGGKGMRIARKVDELAEMIEAARREAMNAFGDGRVFLERYLQHARHVEVQVVGDGHGGAIALGARDCSIQRRHQKIVEESPPPNLPSATLEAMLAAARGLCESTQYRGVGTVEFIVAATGEFYFLEMNTRLQVEHPVTELVHGVDLLALQVAVARGAALDRALESRPVNGHALEVRVYAESPANEFLPSIGRLTEVIWPAGPGIRVDAGVERGSEVSVYYDPLLAKIIVHGADRAQAIERMRAALAETFVAGVDTSLEFCRDLIGTEDFRAGRVFTTFIAERFMPWPGERPSDPWWQAASTAALELSGQPGTENRGGAPRVPAAWELLNHWRLDA